MDVLMAHTKSLDVLLIKSAWTKTNLLLPFEKNSRQILFEHSFGDALCLQLSHHMPKVTLFIYCSWGLTLH